MLIVRCYCCGFSQEFTDGEQAFQAGWDAPPNFTIPACSLCPAAYYFTGIPSEHIKGHERWDKEGRPGSFEQALAKGDIPALSPGALQRARDFVDSLGE